MEATTTPQLIVNGNYMLPECLMQYLPSDEQIVELTNNTESQEETKEAKPKDGYSYIKEANDLQLKSIGTILDILQNMSHRPHKDLDEYVANISKFMLYLTPLCGMGKKYVDRSLHKHTTALSNEISKIGNLFLEWQKPIDAEINVCRTTVLHPEEERRVTVLQVACKNFKDISNFIRTITKIKDLLVAKIIKRVVDDKRKVVSEGSLEQIVFSSDSSLEKLKESIAFRHKYTDLLAEAKENLLTCSEEMRSRNSSFRKSYSLLYYLNLNNYQCTTSTEYYFYGWYKAGYFRYITASAKIPPKERDNYLLDNLGEETENEKSDSEATHLIRQTNTHNDSLLNSEQEK